MDSRSTVGVGIQVSALEGDIEPMFSFLQLGDGICQFTYEMRRISSFAPCFGYVRPN